MLTFSLSFVNPALNQHSPTLIQVLGNKKSKHLNVSFAHRSVLVSIKLIIMSENFIRKLDLDAHQFAINTLFMNLEKIAWNLIRQFAKKREKI